MSHDSNDLFFGPFRLSVVERCLFEGERLVRLTRREFEVLAILVLAGGRVVSKELMVQQIWAGEIVEDSNLAHHVQALRRKLAASGDGRSYVETIPGVGYRLPVAVTNPANMQAVSPKEDLPAASPRDPRPAARPGRSFTFRWSIGACVAVLCGSVLVIGLERRFAHREAVKVTTSIADGAQYQSFPRVKQLIDVGLGPTRMVLSPDRRELYVVEVEGNSVSAFNLLTLRVHWRVAVGKQPRCANLSADGQFLYVAGSDGSVVSIRTADQHRTLAFRGDVSILNMVLSPDGRYIYLALGFAGLGRVDLANGAFQLISAIPFVQDLILTQSGKTLVVSYESGGPGGTRGHDAIGYFNIPSKRLIGVSKNFPNVGDTMTLSPSGSEIWETGADACDSPRYDHLGCPAIPGGIINVLDAVKPSLLRSIGVRGARLSGVTFLPHSDLAVITASERVLVMSTKNGLVIGGIPLPAGRDLVLSSGDIGYVSLPDRNQVAVLEFAVPVNAFRLPPGAYSENSLEVAIMRNPNFEAQWVDPETVRLAGQPPLRDKNGNVGAWVESVPGIYGNNLVVAFETMAKLAETPLPLEGTTYSGIPIRGVVPPRARGLH